MNNIKRKKGGFSMAEVVIAIAVIVIVSIAALVFIDFSIKNAYEISNKTQAQNFAENSLACFKVSDNINEFEANMAFFVEGFEGVEKKPTSTPGYYEYNYESDIYDFIAMITVNFGDDADTFDITVTRKGEEIVAFTYTKYTAAQNGGGLG
jgi:prepilin-type N-terminal cleavage/methylation domain-containing protein